MEMNQTSVTLVAQVMDERSWAEKYGKVMYELECSSTAFDECVQFPMHALEVMFSEVPLHELVRFEANVTVYSGGNERVQAKHKMSINVVGSVLNGLMDAIESLFNYTIDEAIGEVIEAEVPEELSDEEVAEVQLFLDEEV